MRSRYILAVALLFAILGISFAGFVHIANMPERPTGSTICISNLKQIGGALDLYLQDNNDKYPVVFAYSGQMKGIDRRADAQNPSAAGLMSVLFKYYKKPDIWVCPTGAQRDYNASECKTPVHGKRNMVGWMPLPNGKMAWTNYVSYPLNTELGDPNTPTPEYCRGWTPEKAMKKWGNIYSPGRRCYNEFPYPSLNNRLIQDSYDKDMLDKWRPHRIGLTVLYCDGHIARAKGPFVYSPTE